MYKKSYKQILKEALCLKWDKKAFEVHHINHDRNDNRAENLLLLPRKLHRLYHLYFNACVSLDVGNLTDKNINLYMPECCEKYVVKLANCKADMAVFKSTQNTIIFSPGMKGDIRFYLSMVGELIKKYS